MPTPPLSAISEVEEVRPAAPMSWMATIDVGCHQLQARLDQQLARARAHGEDVAQDAADAGRRALVGLDVGWVVVALHLEDDGMPSPMSTTPAFSPGPWITCGPLVGSA